MVPQGLSGVQVAESLKEHGDNALTEHDKPGFWSKFIGNLSDPMIKILIVALAINVVFTFFGKTEWYESAGIAVAVLLATFISTISEYRNETAFQKLQEEASRIICKVYRDGEITEIPINDIVVGDWVALQAGDLVPADGRLVEGTVSVDQSALNGETHEARKEVAPRGGGDAGEAIDFADPYRLYRGSIVYSGNAIMAVSTVGDQSVYGQVASELQLDDDRATPLQVKLGALAKNISIFGYCGGVLIAVALLFQRIVVQNDFDISLITAYCSDWMTLANDFIQALMLAVIIIVMAVPEGLPLMIAIVSALNMGKMLRDNVLVRKIAGIETAGSLNILFSDKTGTITKGQLEAVVFIDGQGGRSFAIGEVADSLRRLLALSIRYNTSAITTGDAAEPAKIIGGNATERAIMRFASGVPEAPDVAVVSTIPFSSANKYSAAQISGAANLTLIKGAPEGILDKCGYYYDGSGRAVLLEDRAGLDSAINELAERAIRVLALATSAGAIEGDQPPGGEWTLVGIIGIRDEIREESITAIREVLNAGVQVVMITGDRKDTAVAVAKEVGLVREASDIVLTSQELSQLDDAELADQLDDIRVISRALPSDKTRLVRVAQAGNRVVGMTGDGVNDSPALKAADVGFAMGSGTEIAKEASEIIIMDDNFSSIDKAILYGRTIFNTIRKFIIFQLTVNVSAVLVTFAAPLLGMENPLTIIQILWVNLVMDTLAALAFGGEPALKRFMEEKPKRRDEPMVSPYMWSAIITGSLFCFGTSLVFLLAPFFTGIFRAGPANDPRMYLLTGYFALFVFTAVFNAFNARTERLNLFDRLSANRGFINVIVLISVVQVAMAYFGGPVLDGYGLSGKEWGAVLVLAALIIPVDLVRKGVIEALHRRTKPPVGQLTGPTGSAPKLP
ncbi:MAG: calcium-translocating P-type ATPase, PMCA-type [Bifidobacteriaceae bacterium]|jgi:calcium-translocating P-type ATPase|nr:calcium-translocating P-type ATPase, PMCA-type [Bifidobacteriaceae bacterium]